MQHSALYPPNRQRLSDAVIGDVMQRVSASSGLSSRAQNDSASVLLSLQKSRFQLPSVHLTVTEGVGGQQRPEYCRPSAHGAESRNASGELELRRQRNRLHQARRKLKQRNKVLGLEESIQKLQAEIQELKLQREVLSAGVMTNTTVWNVAVEYVRLFRYGVRAPRTETLSSDLVARPPTQAQRSFLLATTMPAVVCETGYGADALMESWIFVSQFHPDIDVNLKCLENSAVGLIVGSTIGRLTITENTLRHAFPHLVDDSEGGERMQLAKKLLGQQLVMRGSIHFEWDSENGRIASIQHKADLMTPLLELLGSFEEVSRVFDNARVTPDSTEARSDAFSTS
ncbi:unnamed protein product [Phytophthora lilii]|uniref:Unnamed protein product n=1 Tax=Phytophthora lilii TaxID=2077276 RepID=A0A9W7D8B1_9STRA|nr:unnamed protein product [Phytophthora lilii]